MPSPHCDSLLFYNEDCEIWFRHIDESGNRLALYQKDESSGALIVVCGSSLLVQIPVLGDGHPYRPQVVEHAGIVYVLAYSMEPMPIDSPPAAYDNIIYQVRVYEIARGAAEIVFEEKLVAFSAQGGKVIKRYYLLSRSASELPMLIEIHESQDNNGVGISVHQILTWDQSGQVFNDN